MVGFLFLVSLLFVFLCISFDVIEGYADSYDDPMYALNRECYLCSSGCMPAGPK